MMPPARADHVLISVNPMAGSCRKRAGRVVKQLVHLLAQCGFATETYRDLDELCYRSCELQAEDRLRVVVGAGGDGTLHVLLNQLAEGTPLAMLPLGTENLLAKYVGSGPQPSTLARMIQTGAIVQLDAGRANGRLFMLMATAGFDAEVARRLKQQRAGNIRRASYIRPILSTIGGYDYPRMQIAAETSDGIIRWQACWCFTFNLPQYGFGLRFAPDADPTDNQLHVCTFRRGSFWPGAWYAMNLFVRRHSHLSDCCMAVARRITVAADARVPFELDGDFTGWLPLQLDVVPRRLTLLVPRKMASGGR